MCYSAMETGNYPNITVLSFILKLLKQLSCKISNFFSVFGFFLHFEDEIDPLEREDIETLPNHYDAFIIVISESESRCRCLQLIIMNNS